MIHKSRQIINFIPTIRTSSCEIYKLVSVAAVSFHVLVFYKPLYLLLYHLLGRNKHVFQDFDQFCLQCSIRHPFSHLQDFDYRLLRRTNTTSNSRTLRVAYRRSPLRFLHLSSHLSPPSPHLRSKNSKCYDSFVVFLLGFLCRQLQSTNQIDLPSLLQLPTLPGMTSSTMISPLNFF